MSNEDILQESQERALLPLRNCTARARPSFEIAVSPHTPSQCTRGFYGDPLALGRRRRLRKNPKFTSLSFEVDCP